MKLLDDNGLLYVWQKIKTLISGIPQANDGKLTIQKEGVKVDEFTANQSGDTTVNIVESDPTVPAYVKAITGIDNTITAGSSSTNIPTAAAVESRITTAISEAQVGAATFRGTVSAGTDISGLTTYKAGWYWLVATAGTYVGQPCEVGDHIYCVADFSSAYKDSDFSVVQANVTSITNAEIDTICV